jgi:hypothetical protein
MVRTLLGRCTCRLFLSLSLFRGEIMTVLPPVALVLLLTAALPAQSAAPEPTQAEIQALAEQDVARANVPIVEYHKRLGKSAVPEDMLVRLDAVRKKACMPASEDDAWQCEVEMDMTVPNGGFRSSTVMLRLVRSATGWEASRAKAASR